MKSLIILAACVFACSFNFCGGYSTFRLVNGNYSCSSVGTCIKPYLKIKPLSRLETSFSAGCTSLSRTVYKLYIRCRIEYKRIGNFRTIINVDFFPSCGLKHNTDNKFLEFFYDWILPKELIKECPLKDDDFQMNNLTHPPVRFGPWPDGYYRTSVTFKDDIDDNIYSATAVMRVRNMDNVVEFK